MFSFFFLLPATVLNPRNLVTCIFYTLAEDSWGNDMQLSAVTRDIRRQLAAWTGQSNSRGPFPSVSAFRVTTLPALLESDHVHFLSEIVISAEQVKLRSDMTPQQILAKMVDTSSVNRDEGNDEDQQCASQQPRAEELVQAVAENDENAAEPAHKRHCYLKVAHPVGGFMYRWLLAKGAVLRTSNLSPLGGGVENLDLSHAWAIMQKLTELHKKQESQMTSKQKKERAELEEQPPVTVAVLTEKGTVQVPLSLRRILVTMLKEVGVEIVPPFFHSQPLRFVVFTIQLIQHFFILNSCFKANLRCSQPNC